MLDPDSPEAGDFGAGPGRPDAERGGWREAEAIQEALAVVAMAGDGPKSVLKVLRLPESSTLTVGRLESRRLESFPRDVVAGPVSLISGTHEEYDFGDRRVPAFSWHVLE